jgi:PAS domain S-box-containing protein
MHSSAAHASPEDTYWYRILVEQVPAIIYVCEFGPTGRWHYVSPQIETLLHYTAQEWTADPKLWFERIHPEDSSLVLAHEERPWQEGDRYVVEYRILARDCRVIWFRDEATAFRDPATGHLLMRGILFDITERKQTEQALRQAEEKYRAIFEGAVIGIFQSDLSGRYLSVNPAMARMLGYDSPQELVTGVTDISRQLYADPKNCQAFRILIEQQGVVKNFECQVRRKDGSKIWISVNARAMRKNGVLIGYEGTNVDVTEHKLLEAQFRHAQKMEIVGRLAGGIAHDFNNLMGVILGYSELLSNHLDPTNPGRKQVEEIKQAGERAVALTRQLLAFSRQQAMQPRILDLNLVISDIEKMLHRLIGEDIVLRIENSDRLDYVKTDSGQIGQVIMNLVVNARDAMPQGGTITIRTVKAQLDDSDRREHPYVRPGWYVLLSVTDTGIGMDAQTLSHIFEPFFTTKETGKGTGLGLATVYGIVKQSGGYVWAESEVGRGTTFKVYLPCIQASPEKGSEKQGATNSHRGTETVLVVEDEEALREVTCAFLKSAGYTVLEARNGAEALEIAKNQVECIHLLLTDMVMPGMSGHELAGRVAAINPKIKLAYVSGYTDHAPLHRGLPDEDTPFLSKPFTRQELLKKVRRILESS